MKLGQILSYMAGFVPDDYRDIYRKALAQLRTSSPVVDRAAIEAVLVEDFGVGVKELFDEFDWAPIAAASIGQVYGARLNGRDVCVKVQYPGIAEATESDIRNIEAIVGIMRWLVPNVDSSQIIEDFRARLREECDYGQEALYQARFAAIYSDDPLLKVPRVIRERSSARVLTTERIKGVQLETFVSEADEQERATVSEALFRLAFGTLLSHRLFHADPHPGNLLFRADCDGRLGLVDFGCVQSIDEETRRDLRALLQAAVDGADLRGPSLRALGIHDVDPDAEEVIVRIATEILSPVREPQPFRFSPEFANNISRDAVEAKADLSIKYLTRRGRFNGAREGIMFIVRTLFGLASLWSELRASTNFAEIAEHILADSQPA